MIICPLCSSQLVKGKSNIYCSSYKQGCKFSIPYIICGKRLTDNQIVMLVKSRRTKIIKGFVSKNGNSFDATLKIDDNGKIVFDFPNN